MSDEELDAATDAAMAVIVFEVLGHPCGLVLARDGDDAAPVI